MDERKLCPLWLINRDNSKCNENCAWYDLASGECAILLIASALRDKE